MVDTPVPQPRTARTRHLIAWLVAAAAVILLPGLAALWLAGTPSGMAALARGIALASAGKIVLERTQGTLVGPLRIGTLRVVTPTLQLSVEDLRLDWNPRDLLQRKLSVALLGAASVEMATPPSTSAQPAALPQGLPLPLGLSLDSLRIDKLVIARMSPQDQDAARTVVIELRDIEARLESDGFHHRLHRLQMSAPFGDISGAGEIDGERPFSLQAQATLNGQHSGKAYHVEATAKGTLETLTLHAQATGLGLDGNAEIDATPFAPVPFRRAQIRAGEIDPSAFAAGAPQAALTVIADLQPQPPREGAQPLPPEQWTVSGPIEIANRLSGPLDLSQLPLRSLNARATWTAQRLQLDDIQLRLSGNGRAPGIAAGSARYENGRADAQLELREVSLATLFSKLKPTRLSGKLHASVGAEEQSVVADLHEPRFTARLDVTQRDQTVDIKTARLQANAAVLDASGQIGLAERRSFDIRGTLQRFDPSLYANVPRALLNADVKARGQLAPAVAADVEFVLRDSRFAGRPLTGRGKLQLAPGRLAHSDIALDLAGNRLTAQGAFGRAGDVLALSIDAPRLASLATGPDMTIGGRIKGDVTLSGSFAQPAGKVDLSAADLLLPNAYRIARIEAHGELKEGLDGRFNARLSAAELRLPNREQPLPHQAVVEVDGTRRQHELRASADLDGRNDLSLRASGGFGEAPRGGAPAWSGMLQTLALRGPTPLAFALTAPAPLQVSTTRVALGAAELRGKEVRLRLLETLWSPQEIASRGTLANLPFGLSLDAEQHIVAGGDTLRLGGEWNMRLAEHVDGSIRLFRQSGDLILQGETPLRLELQALELQLNAVRDRLAAALNIRGKQLGEIVGSGTALAARSDSGWSLAATEPLSGSVRANIPSLAWLGPLVDQNLQTDGAVNAEFTVTGTPANPQSQGNIEGKGLAIALADQGLRLGDGVLRAEFTQERLRLAELHFKSKVQVRPRDNRIDLASLTAQPGSVSATGEMLLSTGKGEIRFQADRLTLLQRPDRWLMVSGQGSMQTGWDALSLSTRVVANAGYWELAKAGAPSLGDDVVVLGRQAKAPRRFKLALDVDTDVGDNFRLRGRGLNTQLAGGVRLRTDDKGALRASGSIQTRGGTYDAYGQDLTIERGIINFQGPLENPGLNVLALRKNLAVEAGVEITGTAQKPRVRLVSEPNVPDSEKLSWIVLGRAPDQVSGGDSALLLSAANALLGGESGGGMSRQLAQSLGLDEISVGSGDIRGGGSRLPSSTVAGGATPGTTAGTGGTLNSQIVSLGKRLSASAFLSYEQSLAGAGNVVKLTYNLTRRLSLIGRAGTDNAVDLLYTFSFD